ncbi:MAG TPA: SHOCT domain-containing protein [Actinomycetes bacterium]|nr:SHOCT domain-containing protein [Actinomycetes bacterium]
MTVEPVGAACTDQHHDLVDMLRDLASMRDTGLLTEAEFQRARAMAVAWHDAAAASQPAR